MLDGVAEPEARRAAVALDREGVAARAARDEGEGRAFQVLVDPSQVSRAVAVLAREEIPRREEPGFHEAWGARSLVSTGTEERARAAQALGGELARSLESIDGVVDARVHVAPAAEPDLAGDAPPRPTASVLVRHAGERAPCSEAQVRALVAAAIAGMRPDDVAVVFSARPAARPLPRSWERVGFLVVAAGSVGYARALLGGFVVVVVLALAMIVRVIAGSTRRAE